MIISFTFLAKKHKFNVLTRKNNNTILTEVNFYDCEENIVLRFWWYNIVYSFRKKAQINHFD